MNEVIKRLIWDKYFMLLAKVAAIRSGCNSRPTGAVIVKDKRVIATGYNGTISGDTQCTDRGIGFCLRRSIGSDDKGNKKYLDCPSIHAEQNAINQIAKYGGTRLKGAVIYCTLFPCIHCIKNIASVGIEKVYYETMYKSDDKERDKYWIKVLDKYNIEAERIILNISNIQQIKKAIINPTSVRRL